MDLSGANSELLGCRIGLVKDPVIFRFQPPRYFVFPFRAIDQGGTHDPRLLSHFDGPPFGKSLFPTILI
jgi:hypothetical protein